MRTPAFLLAMLVPRMAAAGPQEDAKAAQEADFAALGAAFDVVHKDAFDEANRLGQEVSFDVKGVPYTSEWEALERRVNHAITGSIPTDDEGICRTAGLVAITIRRRELLGIGWEAGFTFEITCEGSSLTGAWNGAIHGPDDGLVSMTQLASDGSSLGSWSMNIHWAAVPPDPDDADQWIMAVGWPVDEVAAGVDRVLAAITRGQGELVRGLVEDLAESELTEVQGYPAFPDDDTVLAAQATWINGVIADLDHGDLKRLVDRADASVPAKTAKKKSYKKKTKAIQKRWKKAYAKRAARYDAVMDAFRAAHGIDD